MAYDKPHKTKTLTKAFEQRAMAKRHKNSKKRQRMKVDKLDRGESVRPPTRDKEAAQARRWFHNELRKPTVRMTEKAAAQFNRWTNHPHEFTLKLQMLGPTKTVPEPSALAMMRRFIKERDVALEAQGVEEEAKDWWDLVPSRKERDYQALKALAAETVTTNIDDWRRLRNVAVEKYGDRDEGGVPLQMEVESFKDENREWQCGWR